MDIEQDYPWAEALIFFLIRDPRSEDRGKVNYHNNRACSWKDAYSLQPRVATSRDGNDGEKASPFICQQSTVPVR